MKIEVESGFWSMPIEVSFILICVLNSVYAFSCRLSINVTKIYHFI